MKYAAILIFRVELEVGRFSNKLSLNTTESIEKHVAPDTCEHSMHAATGGGMSTPRSGAPALLRAWGSPRGSSVPGGLLRARGRPRQPAIT